VDDDGPVRVLHLVKGLGPGGAERLLVSVAEATDPRLVRHEVAFLLPAKQHLVAELQEHGVTTHLLAGDRGLADPRWPGRLRRLSRGHDVVHLHSPAPAAVARPVVASMRGGPAIVTTEHNVWGSHGLPTRLANALTQPLDDARWAVSAEVVASMWRGWRPRTEVLVHGVPVERLAARRAERTSARVAQGWRDSDVVVVIVANLRANKDYPNLFAAAARALEVEPRLRYAAVGQGPLEAELRERLARLGLGDRFVMLGHHPDPPAILAGADVFTLGSRHEGLPISAIEAMAMAVPPALTRVGGVPEVVQHELHGLLVPPTDPVALAEAHVRLARDPALRARLGAAALSRAADFDIRRTAAKLVERYRSLAGRPVS
jgi:glycosyltransferase involved in cell wall biosynthesis